MAAYPFEHLFTIQFTYIDTVCYFRRSQNLFRVLWFLLYFPHIVVPCLLLCPIRKVASPGLIPAHAGSTVFGFLVFGRVASHLLWSFYRKGRCVYNYDMKILDFKLIFDILHVSVICIDWSIFCYLMFHPI